ncbi:MAG: tetratricopeptide repeat protein [Spirochaetales bacterium]|jgi:tetratricopeptide (TPR) repeat protein|nr:tetratricopeptide repeat protein [Spirochaetales bacterium]
MSLVIIIPIVIIVIIVSAVVYLLIVQTPALKLDSIKQLIDNNNLDEALTKLTKIIQDGKATPRTHMYLGEIFEKKGDINTAVMEYQKCLKEGGFISDSEQLVIHIKLAELLNRMGRVDDALGEYLILAKQYPNDPYYLMQIGDIFFSKKKFGNATNYYKQALLLNNANPVAHYNLGRLYYMTGLNADCEYHLKKAIELSPKFYDSYYYLGLLALRQSQGNNALMYFSKAIYSNKFKGLTYLNLGNLLFNSGKTEEALNFYLKSLSNINNDKENLLLAKYNVGLCYEKLGNIDKAMEYFREVYMEKADYKDVQTKISLYSELSVNDKLKEYIISKKSDFEIIINRILSYFKYKPLETIFYERFVYAIGIPSSLSPDSTNKKDNHFFIFYRTMNDSFTDDELYLMKEKMLSSNCSKMYIIFPGEFPENAKKWSENRDVILIDKIKLLEIFESISV